MLDKAPQSRGKAGGGYDLGNGECVQVDDDVAVCQTVMEEKCEEQQVGYATEQKCDKWPREVCTVERRKVKKSSPRIGCDKTPKLMCAPTGCGIKEVLCRLQQDLF